MQYIIKADDGEWTETGGAVDTAHAIVEIISEAAAQGVAPLPTIWVADTEQGPSGAVASIRVNDQRQYIARVAKAAHDEVEATYIVAKARSIIYMLPTIWADEGKIPWWAVWFHGSANPATVKRFVRKEIRAALHDISVPIHADVVKYHNEADGIGTWAEIVPTHTHTQPIDVVRDMLRLDFDLCTIQSGNSLLCKTEDLFDAFYRRHIPNEYGIV